MKTMIARMLIALMRRGSSAGFPTCCIADFQIGRASNGSECLRVGKPAIQQVGKPALRFVRELCTLTVLAALTAGANAFLPPVSEGLQSPTRVATDAAGNLYVVEPALGQIIAFDAFGRRSVGKENLAKPLAIAVDGAGNFIVSEEAHGSVSVFDSQWALRYKLGRGEGEFSLPNYIAPDSAPGSDTVYVCDGRANQIKACRPGGVVAAFGSGGTGVGQFNFPAGIFVSPAGEVFVVDQGNDRLLVFHRSGAFLRSFALGTGGMFGGPSGRAQGITGGSAGRLYVADSFQGIIKMFDSFGNAQGTLGGFGGAAGQLRTPVDLTMDRFSRLCVASVNNSRVELIGVDAFLQLSVLPAKQFITVGTDVAFAAVAGGSGPFTYQWRKGNNNLADGGNISGATAATMTLTGVTAADSGSYSLVVTGPSGTQTSPNAALTVLAPAQIVAGPISQSVFQGAEVSLSVAATGDALQYQWQRNGADIFGATTPSLTLTNAQLVDGGSYVAVVSNPLGAASTEAATLTVQPLPVSPQLEDFVLVPGVGISFLLNGDAGYTYAIEGSANLTDWQLLTTVTNEPGILQVVLNADPAQPLQFYRARWSP